MGKARARSLRHGCGGGVLFARFSSMFASNILIKKTENDAEEWQKGHGDGKRRIFFENINDKQRHFYTWMRIQVHTHTRWSRGAFSWELVNLLCGYFARWIESAKPKWKWVEWTRNKQESAYAKIERGREKSNEFKEVACKIFGELIKIYCYCRVREEKKRQCIRARTTHRLSIFFRLRLCDAHIFSPSLPY